MYLRFWQWPQRKANPCRWTLPSMVSRVSFRKKLWPKCSVCSPLSTLSPSSSRREVMLGQVLGINKSRDWEYYIMSRPGDMDNLRACSLLLVTLHSQSLQPLAHHLQQTVNRMLRSLNIISCQLTSWCSPASWWPGPARRGAAASAGSSTPKCGQPGGRISRILVIRSE